MQAYNISSDPSIRWRLFAGDASGFSLSAAPQIAQVLAAVRNVFISIFGADIVNSHPTLAVVYSKDGPQIFRENNLIFLSSADYHHQQHIFQFSHELCHFMVPSGVCQKYRWFEESLCQMMSWYTMQRIFDTRFTTPIPSYLTLYESTPAYISETMSERVNLGNASLSAFLRLILPNLQSNCYIRAVNYTVAHELYPLFVHYPQLWMVVPELHRLTEDMEFFQAIRFLCDAISVPEDLRRQLMQLLWQ